MQRYLIITLAVLFVGGPSPLAWAENVKPLLETKIVFDGEGKSKVSYDTHGQSDKDTVSNKIQSSLIFYAYAMNQMDSKTQTTLLNEIQKMVGFVATDEGLKRPNFIKHNPYMPKPNPELAGKGFDLTFSALPGKGNNLNVKPMGEDNTLKIPAVLSQFQDLITNLPTEGLRLMVLAMGGMNKWYREIGKASDANSVSKAPSYGLNLAVDILAKVSGKKI